MRYVANVKPWKLSQLAVRVFHEDAYNHSEKENALRLAEHLEQFFRGLGLRTRLSELGIDDKHFAEMAKRATRNGTVGHYLPIDEKVFVEILKLAL